MTPAASCSPPLLDWLCAAIVQLEAIKNVDKIISNSIYILKDNLPFTGTNNIINSINSCSPFCPLCLRCVAIHRCRCRIWNLSCGAARCLFTFLPSLSLASLALLQFVSNWNSANIFEFVCLATLWPRFQSARFCWARRRGRRDFGFMAAPSGHILHLPPTFIDCLGCCSLLLLLLSLSLHLAPVEGPAWHPLFWFLSTAWICKLPGLNRAWPACRGGNKASHFTTSSNCVGRILAAAPRCLKTFLAKCFFPPVFWPIKHAAAPHSPSTDDTIFGVRPGAVPDTDTGIMCWPR